MKALTILLTTLFFCNYSYGQKSKVKLTAKEKKVNRESKNLLSDEAFDKMIIQDITYAIFGENNPVSGIKLDISKPEATISGVFKIKKPMILLGFDFKGGITDKNFSIFKGVSNFNTAFEFKPSIHFIPSCNSAKYIPQKETFVRAKRQLIEKFIKSQIDTFLVTTLIFNYHLEKFKSLIHNSDTLPNSSTITPNQKQILISLIRKFIKKDDPKLSMANNLNVILSVLNQVPNINGDIDVDNYIEEIVEAYKKYKNLNLNKDEEKFNKEISNANESWTKKSFYWFTLSPFARTEKLNLYHTKFKDIDSSYFKQDYPFYYGISGSFNMLSLYPNKFANYLKIGINLSNSNNLTTLNSFNYETRTAFYSYGNSSTEKTKTGIAYNKSDVKSDFLGQLGAEYYLLPLKSFIPGLYLSTSLNVSSLYRLNNIVGRENDNLQISSEGGLVFNINSREKDKEKSILSLSMYVRFEDITDTKRTSKQDNKLESKDDYLKRNLSFGLKVGVPITLPQKK